MAEQIERIPFEVEVNRIIEVLAVQIYQTPLALLRENAQNAFDAILLRIHDGQSFDPRVDVTITADSIEIVDNGIGMTQNDLRSHFWKAGSSSKNTDAARDAGVVGTFGIGAMANFGIADELSVETESALTGERTLSSAAKATLSTSADCIVIASMPPVGSPGTKIVAKVLNGVQINAAEATSYIAEFVRFVTVPVFVNGQLVSQQPISAAVPSVGSEEVRLDNFALNSEFTASMLMRFSGNGDVWVHVRDLIYAGVKLPGEMIFRQGMNTIRTFRSGFGLAAVAVSSAYQFGGVADLVGFKPTAGREALTTESMQLLQSFVSALDSVVSEEFAKSPQCNESGFFMEWVRRHQRFDLCGHLQARVQPGEQRKAMALLSRDADPNQSVLMYGGSDSAIIDAIASDDSPLVVLASTSPRRDCENGYLSTYCNVEVVDDQPKVLSRKPKHDWTLSEQALVFRVGSVLESDYFLAASVELGKLSHGLPIVASKENDAVAVVIDSDSQTVSLILSLYDSDYGSFGSMVKDYVRNIVFSRVSDYVPSSTRQGAEAFLKTIRRTRDVFEYEYSDLDKFSSIWEDYVEGRLSMSEVVARSASYIQRNVQVVDVEATQNARDVVPDVVDNEAALHESGMRPEAGPAPAILRTDIRSDAKLLTLEQSETPVKGYRCFIALSDRAREERGDFFLQPHSTSIVWGGQKVLFVFEHHSGEFGLYYDLQTSQSVTTASGGGPYATATLVLQNRIYLPVPDEIADSFVPSQGEKKRFDVRCDLLYTDGSS